MKNFLLRHKTSIMAMVLCLLMSFSFMIAPYQDEIMRFRTQKRLKTEISRVIYAVGDADGGDNWDTNFEELNTQLSNSDITEEEIDEITDLCTGKFRSGLAF